LVKAMGKTYWYANGKCSHLLIVTFGFNIRIDIPQTYCLILAQSRKRVPERQDSLCISNAENK
jgi:hypothetical protein